MVGESLRMCADNFRSGWFNGLAVASQVRLEKREKIEEKVGLNE